MSERRRASVQVNFRVEPEVADVIKEAFGGRGELTEVAKRLLYAEALEVLARRPPGGQLSLDVGEVAA